MRKFMGLGKRLAQDQAPNRFARPNLELLAVGQRRVDHLR